MLLYYFLCVLLAYLIGTFSPSYLIGKINGADIRELGSKNAGASNVVINYGKLAGFITALTDIFKAFLAVHICMYLFPTLPFVREIAGVFVVLGHIFPWYMHFRGGKGLACLGGVILGNHARVFLILLLIAFCIVMITKYVCMVPISISISYPLVYGALSGSWIGAAIYLVLPVVICWKHVENVKRIRTGTEARISYLWAKDKEMERLQRNKDAAEGK